MSPEPGPSQARPPGTIDGDSPGSDAPAKKVDELTTKLLGSEFSSLDERAKRVAQIVAEGRRIVRNVNEEYEKETTFGQRAADRVASFGGSWTFVGLFAAVMILWIALNAFFIMSRGKTFDPYPYILLNLFLSMLAAIQAPVILMSQNRHSDKDRLNAEHDYEVNLKAELDIMLLHEKMDLLREKQWEELLVIQKDQLKILTDLIQLKSTSP
jgi:uncharacterized membrane protein